MRQIWGYDNSDYGDPDVIHTNRRVKLARQNTRTQVMPVNAAEHAAFIDWYPHYKTQVSVQFALCNREFFIIVSV